MDFDKLWRFDLTKGNSNDPRNGACVMDAISWLEYGKLGDHPECTCPIIAAYCRRFNDGLPDNERQKLKLYIPRLVGTVDKTAEKARAEFLVWNVIRVIAPIALDAAGMKDDAEKMRGFTGIFQEAREAYCEIRSRINYPADAADAAAYAAAADAAYAAAYAADAAAYAAAAYAADAYAADAALKQKLWAAGFAALDGVLLIGKQAEPMDMGAVNKGVRTFAKARGESVAA